MKQILLILQSLATLAALSSQGWTVEPQLTANAAARAKQLKAAVTSFEVMLKDYR
jgi:hypothetical protein